LRVRGYVKWVVAIGLLLALLVLDFFQRRELERSAQQILDLTTTRAVITVESFLSQPADIVGRLLSTVDFSGLMTQEEFTPLGEHIVQQFPYVVQTGIITEKNLVVVEYPYNPSALYSETIAKILYSGGKTFISDEGGTAVYISDINKTTEGEVLLYSALIEGTIEGTYAYVAVSADRLISQELDLSRDDYYWLSVSDSQKQELLSHNLDEAIDVGVTSSLWLGGDNPWTLKVGLVYGWNRGWVVGRFINFAFGVVLAIIIWILIFLLDRRARTLHSEVDKRTKSLENVNKEMEEFVFVVSHDLKAPLITIQGMIDLFIDSEGKKLPKRSREFVESIKIASERMGDLIGDLLQLSRVGRFDTDTEEVNIAEVVEVVFSEVRTVDKKGLFDFIMEGSFPELKVNRRRIYQIFANLVNNAVKFMDQENAEPFVKVTCRDRGEFYEFRVIDNGPGIDPRYHKKIFGVFQRLHGRQVEGTGIGLAFVRKIVENMGGIIWVESEVGRGCQFVFSLPKEG